MSKDDNNFISNPYSTGGGGGLFEAHVQASFVALMLTGGFAPCLPNLPIKKIQLQGRVSGFNTDDLIVFVEKEGGDHKGKLLCQVKHTIGISNNDKIFGKVIKSAWNDFNNSKLFTRNKDAIALITGPLSATDINDTRTILEWSRALQDSTEYFNRVQLSNFSNLSKQKKLHAFRINLCRANGGKELPDEDIFQFLRHFHLLSYDLDIKAGVVLSLLHSLIGQYSSENASSIWTRLVDEVQSLNQNAGTITFDSLPENLRDDFTKREFTQFPRELLEKPFPPAEIVLYQFRSTSDLAIVNLIGGWDEKYKADQEIIHCLANQAYESWISKIREILLQPASPLSLNNGRWRVTERKDLWTSLGEGIFDSGLDRFTNSAVVVLSERDPKFDLTPENRYAANLYGKVLNHSPELRKGIAESLALLGNYPNVLTNCSNHKPETIVILTIREIFENADWKLWGSLDNLLPILAEAAPEEFLNIVERALEQSPCPFDELFAQEGVGITGANYVTGVLWALETLAWDEKYLVRVCVILGELAIHDPGGNWLNRPANSLTEIFLPWLPQTIAPVDKRKVALQTLAREYPTIAWKLLLSFMPGQHQMSSGTRRPTWRNTIPDDWNENVSQQEYWEQVSFYADLAVSMASQDDEFLCEIIERLDCLPQSSFDRVIELLSSDDIINKTEDERLVFWTSLIEFTSKHRRYSDASWALSGEQISKIEDVSKKLTPSNPLNLYRSLFGANDIDLYEESENWEEQRKKLQERRNQAMREILAYGGMKATIEFAEAVEAPTQVGHTLGSIAQSESDTIILPALLETESKKLEQFASSYIWSRHYIYGWNWVDQLDRSGWSVNQTGKFLSYLPFTLETWDRVGQWLGDSEREYWIRTAVHPYGMDLNLVIAVDKLLDNKRPHAALYCLYELLHNKQPIDKTRSVKALLAAVSSEEPSFAMDRYIIIEIIKYLQDDPGTDIDDLIRVEWAYLLLLDRSQRAYPKLLEHRLASDPDFFCEVIRLLYRSKKNVESDNEPSEAKKSIATNASRLLREWRLPPGTQSDDSFSGTQFIEWIEKVKTSCAESGHLEVALTHVGQVLIYAPPDPDGLWINKTVAEVLNAKGVDEIRTGFRLAIFNSRGVHFVDPTGKPERELAEQYRQKADEIENAGFQRFAATLRELAETYVREADQINAEHKYEKD